MEGYIVVHAFRSSFSVEAASEFQSAELVAAMSEHRTCDICLNPWAGRGQPSRCTAECPSRRGMRRRDVRNQLIAGDLIPGVHPRSRMVAEAHAHLMRRSSSYQAEMEDLDRRLALLQSRRLHCVQRREETLQALVAMMEYYTQPDAASTTSRGDQPESEP